MDENKNIENSLSSMKISDRGIILRSYDDLLKFSLLVYQSDDAIQKKFKNPESVLIAIQFGSEVGLHPLQSIQNVGVINGIPALYGDAAKALVLGSNLCIKFKEYFEGKPYDDDFTAICITKRKGAEDEHIETFSVADAKRAGLWNKEGTWRKYPKRMLRFRARGFNLRDNFTDVLKGFKTIEEISDYEIISSTTNNTTDNVKKHGNNVRNIMSEEPPED